MLHESAAVVGLTENTCFPMYNFWNLKNYYISLMLFLNGLMLNIEYIFLRINIIVNRVTV